MGKLDQLSVKKSLCLIAAVTVLAAVLLSAVSVRICSGIRDRILLSHAFILPPAVISPEEDGSYRIDAAGNDQREEPAEYTGGELLLCRITQVLLVFLPIFYSFAGIGFASSVFYRVKLKEPLNALKQGIAHIADNDLTFSIEYQKQDELGKLCGAFETMRRELLENNHHMWDMLEERKKMNASISHDLRTPVTVIKGYSEYLDKNAGKAALTDERIREIAGYIHQAASRLEAYADSVYEVQSLEDMSLEFQPVSLAALQKEMQTQVSVLTRQHKIEIKSSGSLPDQLVSIAPIALFRIVENLVSNSIRYCNKQINLNFSFLTPFLTIVVTDDGTGFSRQDREEAVHCFYKGKKAKGHFGIGLTICKILAEKHGGSVVLDNVPGGGARVTVKIKTEEPPVL